MGEVELERLAEAYPCRADDGGADRAAVAARASGLSAGRVAVDVGGGRGSHGAVFASFGARVVVVDPSPAMATAARARGLATVLGVGERLPLADAVAGLVYFHLSIHHGEPKAMLGEAVRVVEPGGMVWVWTLAAHHHRASFLARWFPSVAAIDERRFPDPDGLAAALAARGLEGVAIGESRRRVMRTAGSWEAAVRAGFVSTLHLLDPAEIEAGLDRFRAAHPDPDVDVEYDMEYRSVHGIGPRRRH